jgi:signal transduction histidine kinase
VSTSGQRQRCVASARSAAGSVTRQFALATAAAVTPVLLALVVFALLMIISGDAALLVAAVVIAAGVLSIIVAAVFGRQAGGDVETIRRGLDAVRDGEREVRISTAADDELRQLAMSANEMIEQLAREEKSRAQAESARRDLVAAVSHDLRTPITSLRLLAEAIGDDIVSGAQRASYLQRMRTHIQALGALIDDLFELSRLEAGDITWSLQRVPLDELVGETIDAMRVQAEAERVRVVSTLPAEQVVARANPEKVQRVLFNLIQNAIRHTPADGSIVVRAEPTATGVEIEVADSGDGIAADERERVFRAFYRGGADGARSGEGAGLGLAVARAIVEAHGGRIWLAESLHGTRVRFSLPTASPSASGARVSHRPDRTASAPSNRKP